MTRFESRDFGTDGHADLRDRRARRAPECLTDLTELRDGVAAAAVDFSRTKFFLGDTRPSSVRATNRSRRRRTREPDTFCRGDTRASRRVCNFAAFDRRMQPRQLFMRRVPRIYALRTKTFKLIKSPIKSSVDEK